MRERLKRSAVILISLWILVPRISGGADRLVGEGLTLKGEAVVESGESIRVLPGALLTVEGVLIVKGKLALSGKEGLPAKMVLKNPSSYGVVVRGGEIKGTDFTISGGQKGIEVYSGSVTLTRGKSTFSGIHVSAAGAGMVEVEGVEFNGGKGGAVFRAGSKGAVKGCSFSGQKKAGVYVYGTKGVEVRKNRFGGSKAGVIISLYGAEVLLEGNRFEGNEEGVRVEKLAGPRIRRNTFSGNGRGIAYSKRGMGTAAGNVFADNRVSVYVEYSSYPVVRGNDFYGYGEFAVLIRNQSSEWEEQASDTDREGGMVPFSGPPFGKGKPQAPSGEKLKLPGETLTGLLDFKENYWGGLTGEIEEKGPGGNISGISDGMDTATFEYRGKLYKMDRVDIQEYRTRPVRSEGR